MFEGIADTGGPLKLEQHSCAGLSHRCGLTFLGRIDSPARKRLIYSGTCTTPTFYIDYDYLTTGDMTKVRENGATSGIGVLATYAYDSLGRRTSLTFGNGASQAYTYDPVSRLASLKNDLTGTGTTYGLTIGTPANPMTYNPAGQILSQLRSNDLIRGPPSTRPRPARPTVSTS